MTSPLFTLTERVAPWVIFAPRDDRFLTDQLVVLRERGGLVVHLPARELMEPERLFRAFAHRLGFPGYYGHNWDALVDCLADLHGPSHGRTAVAVMVDDADVLLDASHLPTLVSVLGQAAERANLQLDADGEPTGISPIAQHFVFSLTSTRARDLLDGLEGPEQEVEVADPYLLVTLDMW
ncbi:barstar family protein [Actinoallomurus sp. NPDC052308]|uniref:barstar family protein n=1 Tax=Actinoallomurus sp. NPDC052308 TaxID=3155530 RepID=UPI0034240481